MQITEFKIALFNPPVLQGYPFAQWNTSLIEYFIQDRFSVKIGRRQISRILKKLGFIPGKTTPELIQTNKTLQKELGHKCKKSLKKLFHMDKRSPYWIQTEKSNLENNESLHI